MVISMNDMNIYADIYNIVNENMQNAGEAFRTPEICFEKITSSDPVTADISELAEISDNSDFLLTAYRILLQRNIDDNARKSWEERMNLPSPEFQKLVVRSILRSAEFANTRIKVKNNIYSEKNAFGGNIEGIRKASSVTMPEKLMNMYRKMPAPVKRAAKKIMGVD